MVAGAASTARSPLSTPGGPGPAFGGYTGASPHPMEGRMSVTGPPSRAPQDAQLMEVALKLAETAVTRGQTPFGAVLVDKDGVVVGAGHNTVRADRDPTAHAEVVAIRDAWRRAGTWRKVAGGTLYSSCEPCLLCAFVITQIGLARVVFAARGTDVPTYRPLLGADLTAAAAWVNAQPDWAPIEVVGDFMRDRARATIEAFPWARAVRRE
jgi:tRNA(adenine34) deaminase